MKKTILFLTISIVIFGLINAQETDSYNHILRIGINRAFFGSGDITGLALSGEYTYTPNKYLGLTLGALAGSANEKSENTFHQVSTFIVSLSLNITPMPEKFRRLKFDLGGLYSWFFASYGSFNPVGNYTYTWSRKEDSFGLLGSARINIIDNDNFELGVRYILLATFYDSFTFDGRQLGLYFGKRF